MGFTISKNQGSGRTVITVTPEEKNSTDKDIVQILTVEAVDGSTKEVKLIHKKGEGNYEYDFRVSPTELYFEPTGESKLRANENGDGFSNLIEIVLQDSIGTVTVYLPSDGNEGIYNNVYYTLIGSNIVNEVSLQRSQALGIINNVGKYENIIKECDNILAMFENKEPTNGSQFNEEFASFRKDVVSVLQSQQQAINLMMDSLGLNKPKENPDGK